MEALENCWQAELGNLLVLRKHFISENNTTYSYLTCAILPQPWPINGGICANATEEKDNEDEKEVYHELLLTGHEDGSVRFWDADGVALAPLYKFSSEPFFSTGDDFDDDIVDENGDEDDWPPFRKVNLFYC